MINNYCLIALFGISFNAIFQTATSNENIHTNDSHSGHITWVSQLKDNLSTYLSFNFYNQKQTWKSDLSICTKYGFCDVYRGQTSMVFDTKSHFSITDN